MIENDTKLEIAAEHYRDSFEILQNRIKHRERFFFFVICILIIMLFELYAPECALKITDESLKKHVGIETHVDFSFISSVVWFCLLSVSIKYFQAVVSIERQYKYIHKIEEYLSKEFSGELFTREGRTYLNNYPHFEGVK